MICAKVRLAEVHFAEPPLGGYTYRLGAAVVEPGSRVRVPFGRQMRVGFVTRLDDGADEPGLKDVSEVVDATPLLPPDLLELTKWLADYYLCDWGEAIAAAVPAGLKPRGRPRYRLTDAARAEPWIEGEAGPTADLWRALAAQPLTQLQIRRRFPQGEVCLGRFRRRGWVEAVEAETPHLSESKEILYRWTGAIGFDEAQLSLPKTAARQRRVIEMFRDNDGELGRREISSIATGMGIALRGLVKKGWVEARSVRRSYLSAVQEGLAETAAAAPELSPRQQMAIAEVRNALRAGGYRAFLLYGVTGSGKSLVYLDAVRAALDTGRGAIVLVPEISLTPQLAGRLRRCFGDRVAISHSGMSARERQQIWHLARSGSVSVVVGPRSAVFVPVQRLGLIVVDEEHDDSYKQDAPPPRYHARAAALFRASRAGAVILLGSATPDVVTYQHTRAGRIRLLELPERHQGAGLPAVWVVKWGAQAAGSVFSPQLRSRLEARLERGEQSILLVNRRGFATYVRCPECGSVAKCPNCDITLRYHRVGIKLECHYCGFSQRALDSCPECLGARLRYGGIGTQRVERELELLYPAARVARMDLDTTRGAGSAQDILQGLADRQFDVLLGTQMVAKGHDFPGVTLVGVLGADGELMQPDFRSLERTFRLLVQASGRTGRAGSGEVVIQCLNPSHPALRWVQSSDYRSLFDAEVRFRQPLRYPPFGRLVAITVRGEDVEAVVAASASCRELLAGGLKGYSLLGPAAPAIERLDRLHRRRLLVKLPATGGAAVQAAKEAIRTMAAEIGKRFGPKELQVMVDVDPSEL